MDLLVGVLLKSAVLIVLLVVGLAFQLKKRKQKEQVHNLADWEEGAGVSCLCGVWFESFESLDGHLREVKTPLKDKR